MTRAANFRERLVTVKATASLGGVGSVIAVTVYRCRGRSLVDVVNDVTKILGLESRPVRVAKARHGSDPIGSYEPKGAAASQRMAWLTRPSSVAGEAQEWLDRQ
jgi:hypothetical protein